MTVGSAGACNVILKSILDPGDEVIVLMPFFPEYQFYIANHGGRMVPVETDATFLPDVERIAAAITPRTRAIMLNTPNNPTGRVYPESVLRDLERALVARSHIRLLVISDEPYKSFVYDGRASPKSRRFISNTAICNSWSKSLGLPGERIGYLALSPTSRRGRSCATPALSPTAHSALSTRPQSGSGSCLRSLRSHRLRALRAKAQCSLRCAPGYWL